MKDCFIESNGANMCIDWKESFRLINNEILTPTNITSRIDASIRTFRVKNFFKILPTYSALWNREVWGITSAKCPRCMIEEETWDHIWICGNNELNNSEFNLFKESILEVLSYLMTDESDDKSIKEFEEKLFEVASTRSILMSPDNMLRELTRGIVNEKWISVCVSGSQKNTLREIFDMYLGKIQSRIWIERCNETVELEKQMGIFRDLKRKRREERSEDAEGRGKKENLENYKNKKKLKKC